MTSNKFRCASPTSKESRTKSVLSLMIYRTMISSTSFRLSKRWARSSWNSHLTSILAKTCTMMSRKSKSGARSSWTQRSSSKLPTRMLRRTCQSLILTSSRLNMTKICRKTLRTSESLLQTSWSKRLDQFQRTVPLASSRRNSMILSSLPGTSRTEFWKSLYINQELFI